MQGGASLPPLLGAALALLLLGAPALAQHEHDGGLMGEAAPSGSTTALYNAEDLQFLHHMSVHHSQALDMAALLPGRTERGEFQRFARYVEGAQAAEIAMMAGMLAMAAERGLSAPPHDMSGDPPMAGMLTAAEMAALAAARGTEFERLWLEGMIVHHDGGLAMARAQQLQQLHYGRRPYGLEGLVEEILIVQRAEITTMRGWLRDWGLADGDEFADRRDPAVEVTGPTPGAILPAGRPSVVFGLAVDDTDIAAVTVGIHDLDADTWLRRDGSWGVREPLPVETARSGPASTAWSLAWTPPAPGRYALIAEAEDVAGRRAATSEPRELGAE
jgi:uncharacterized protein (DUF305 family)